MNGHARRRSRSAVAAGALVIAASLTTTGLAALPIEQTAAAWQLPNFHQATLTSGTLNAVPTLACGAAAGLLAVTIPIIWTAPATGVAPTGYLITWAGTAGSGSATINSTATSGSIPGGALSVLGQSIVTVYATRGSWTSPVSLASVKVTTISALGVIVSWTCGPNP